MNVRNQSNAPRNSSERYYIRVVQLPRGSYGAGVGVSVLVRVMVRVNVLLGVNVRVRVLVRVGDLVLVSVGAVMIFASTFTNV